MKLFQQMSALLNEELRNLFQLLAHKIWGKKEPQFD